MNDKKIAVYYIATGDYKSLFYGFLKSLDNFFPQCEKVVKLISDGLEEYNGYSSGNVKVELCPRINNYPWPIIALYKMWHIYENFDDSYDFSCYFNANTIINEHDPDVFDLNKMTVSYHSFDYIDGHYDIWPFININPASCAYLENKTYEYVQSGFFFGPSPIVKEMCKNVVDMVNHDSAHYLYAQWHDESYFNKWCINHPDLVDKKKVMTVYREIVDKKRFLFLLDKKKYKINK